MKNIAPLFLTLILTIAVFSQTAEVISNNASLRGTPSDKGKVVDVLTQGSNLEIIKQNDVWFLVQSTDFVGWIHKNTIKLNQAEAKKEPKPFPQLQVITGPVTPSPQTETPSRPTPSRVYIRGSRGGCYYINSNGKKTYVSKSLCN